MSAMDLSHSELDMDILGQISACTNQREDVVVKSRHVATGRKHSYSSYTHQGKPVCPRMFRFLHVIGTFRNLKMNKCKTHTQTHTHTHTHSHTHTHTHTRTHTHTGHTHTHTGHTHTDAHTHGSFPYHQHPTHREERHTEGIHQTFGGGPQREVTLQDGM